MKDPRIKEEIRRDIVDGALRENYAPTQGIVLSYDPALNYATVATARPGTQQIGEIFTNVPCPQTNGVQGTAPEPGRPCWIGFPDGTKTSPVIISFFNPSYRENDYDKQYGAVNDIPRFMTDM